MTIKAQLTGSGVAGQAAVAITGDKPSAITAAGSVSTDATLLPIASHFNVSTATSNQGVIFPPGNGSGDSMAAGDWGTIYNSTANTIKVYPPAGKTLNGGAANASVSMTTLQKAVWVCLDGSAFTLLVA